MAKKPFKIVLDLTAANGMVRSTRVFSEEEMALLDEREFQLLVSERAAHFYREARAVLSVKSRLLHE